MLMNPKCIFLAFDFAIKLLFYIELIIWISIKHDQATWLKANFCFRWRDWCWSWNSNTLATWCGELTHLKRPWCWERLRAGEGDDRGWDGWMASPTQWTWVWVWVNSGSWWWTGRPGVLWSMGLPSQTRLSDWIDWILSGLFWLGQENKLKLTNNRNLLISLPLTSLLK